MLLRGSPILDQNKLGEIEPGVSRESISSATRGSVTPVPERLWAIRNVANSLAQFGEGGEGQVSPSAVASMEVANTVFMA